MENSTKQLYLSVVSAAYIVATYVLFVVSSDQKRIWLSKEDGIFEWVGAFCFLLSASIFMINYLRSRNGNDLYFYQTNKNIFFLLLMILFFIAFGEEISWGQRIFNINTPEYIAKVNMQDEINIHNLVFFERTDAEGNEKSQLAIFLNIDRLFSIFWFSYCLVLPLILSKNSRVTRLIKQINIPVPPLALGIVFMGNYFIQKMIEGLMVTGKTSESLIELKESNFGFLFFALALGFFISRRDSISDHLK